MSEVLLHTEGLTRRFGGLLAIDHVDLEARQGEVLGLIGPNGAGKTTLFNLIAGTHEPSAGSIVFRGESLVGLAPHEVCKRGLTRTFQITKPFQHLTVLDNVMVGAFNVTRHPAEARARAQETLAFCGLEARADRAAGTLSVPERKRLELARALATAPKLLLLDEVMAGLNPREHDTMIALIGQIRERGISLLVIEHAMKVIMSISQRIVVIHHGQKIAEGSPREISSDARVIEAYLGEEYRIA
ncbi:MAG TPA: ABC transporter ATP-binding protein [bacterium]|nr:ABC transporter ATP-binding protein [bacterium]